MHFYQQTISSRLRDLCYRQTWHTELYPAGTRYSSITEVETLLLTFIYTQSPPFFSPSQGERKARGSQEVWFKQQLTARHHCGDFYFSLAYKTRIHTQKVRRIILPHNMLTKYSHGDGKVHWQSFERGNVGGGAARKRSRVGGGSDDELLMRSFLSVYVPTTWHDPDVHLIWPDHFAIYFRGRVCMWCNQHKQPDIYFMGEKVIFIFFAFDYSWN